MSWALRVSAQDRYDLVTRLTLVLILLSPGLSGVTWVFKLPLSLAAIAGLCCPPLHRQAGLWWGLTAVLGWKTIAFWWSQDNHVFLYTYWCLAVAWSLSLQETDDRLANAARWLVGGSFACAVVWKGGLSADFLDGTFFYHALLTDSRFYDLSRLGGGLSHAMAQYNHTVLRELTTSATVDSQVRLQSPERLRALAQAITWWTVGLESAIAVAFLGPHARSFLRPARHALVLLFAWTTYLVATVETFGLLLTILGVAQCDPSHRYTRLLYLATFGLIILYDQVPLLSFF